MQGKPIFPEEKARFVMLNGGIVHSPPPKGCSIPIYGKYGALLLRYPRHVHSLQVQHLFVYIYIYVYIIISQYVLIIQL